MKKTFYLYLDESGDFTHDDEIKGDSKWNPSLIGGVLLEEKILPDEILAVFQGESHCKNEDADIVFEKFKAINELNVQYVIFCNDEHIKVINNNLTYQNIMAQGISQLLIDLKNEHKNEEIFLEICIAGRIVIGDDEERQKGQTYNYVDKGDYVERLKERLIMAGYHKNVSTNDWRIYIQNALKYDMLKLADVVCNTYLTRNTKFKQEKYQLIRNVYDKDPNRVHRYSVFHKAIQQLFKDAMADGRIGDAVTILCQHEDKGTIKNSMDTVKKQLALISPEDMKIQYKLIAAWVEHFINVEKDYEKSLKFLDNLLVYFVPVLESVEGRQQFAFPFKRDLYFYKLTVCTHKGDIKASDECEKVCDALLKENPYALDMVEYQLRYCNRKIINRINQFDFEIAHKECQNLIGKCERAKDILSLWSDEEGDFSDDGYQELGKAYSNQVQIYSLILRQKKHLYKEAADMSERAIREMNYDLRQYQYRSVLETEALEYDRALLALIVAAGILNPVDTDISQGESALDADTKEKKKLCREMVQKLSCSSDEYLVANYIRLMAEGSIGNWDFADEMYRLYSTSALNRELSEERSNLQHPYQIIYWKLATCYANRGDWKAALRNYEEALKVCVHEKSELTLQYIGFAVKLERFAYTLKCNDRQKILKFKKDLVKNLTDLYKDDIAPESMRALFSDIQMDNDDWKYYFAMSRRITY